MSDRSIRIERHALDRVTNKGHMKGDPIVETAVEYLKGRTRGYVLKARVYYLENGFKVQLMSMFTDSGFPLDHEVLIEDAARFSDKKLGTLAASYCIGGTNEAAYRTFLSQFFDKNEGRCALKQAEAA